MPRRRSLVAEGSLVAVTIAALVGCVDVPDSVRAQFAGPGAQDRSNYRPGRHGAFSNKAAEPPPSAKASPPAEADASVDADAQTDTDAAGDPDADAGAP